jgi:PKD repeat protein
MRAPRTSFAHRSSGAIRVLILAATGSALLALGAAEAAAVITEPIPADVGATPPPITALPPAGETAPPAEAISDPITPEAACGGWARQSSYGGFWSTDSTWWEYACVYSYPKCSGMCNADWGPYVWTDHFYWDGSRAVFYGEFYGDFYFDSMWSASGCAYWWDAPTDQWYIFEAPGCGLPEEPPNATPTASFTLACSGASCSLNGSASSDSDGTIADYSWTFGDGTGASGATADHAYAEPGTYTVTLTVTDDRGAWARDSKVVTIESSPPPPPPPNAAPTAAFTSSCSAPSCSFDAGGSTDRDGTITAYSWDFGDGTSGGGVTAGHTYTQAGNYTVALTVTDDGGATATDSKSITVIGLTARAYKVKRLQKVDLSWNGPSGVSFDVYRDGAKIATVSATAYTDTLGKGASGSHSYQVCQAAVPTSTCSNQAAVSF